MRTRRALIQRIARHLESEGYEVEIGESTITFRSDRATGTVRIVEDDASVSDLLSAALEAYHDSSRGMLAYVAAPSILIERVGVHVFRFHSLELLRYTGTEVEEVVPPRTREVELTEREPEARQEERGGTQRDVGTEVLTRMLGMLEELLRKVENLEARVSSEVLIRERAPAEVSAEITEVLRRLQELEARVAALEGLRRLVAEVDALRARVESLARQLASIASQRQETAVAARPEERRGPEPASEIERSELPSFLKDNPWVEILSRKGRERA